MSAESVELVQLSIENITVGYHGIEVVKGFSLTLGNGQIGCLLGPSGCGKSTVLRAMAGFEPVMSGTITMADQLFSSADYTLPPESRQVGMVFQDLALFPHLNVEQNIRFGLRHWTEADQKMRVDELLSLVGLPSIHERFPHSLSGGQQQRIALARAMAPKPKLLLLDEPFSGIDTTLKESLVPEVRDILLQEQVTVLLVTHDQVEAFVMADKVAVMQEGQVIQCDIPYNIYHEPLTTFVSQFVGEGDFLNAIVVDDSHVQSPLGMLNAQGHDFAINQSVKVLVRPEDLLHDDNSEIKAKIISKQFRGSHFLYRVQLPSQQVLYCFASSHHDHALGEYIGVKLDLDHVVMFAQ